MKFPFEKETGVFLKAHSSYSEAGAITLTRADKPLIELEIRSHVKGSIYDVDSISGSGSWTAIVSLLDMTDPQAPVNLGQATLSAATNKWTGSLDLDTANFATLFVGSTTLTKTGYLEFQITSASYAYTYRVAVTIAADGIQESYIPYQFVFRDMQLNTAGAMALPIPDNYDAFITGFYYWTDVTTLPVGTTTSDMIYGFCVEAVPVTKSEITDNLTIVTTARYGTEAAVFPTALSQTSGANRRYIYIEQDAGTVSTSTDPVNLILTALLIPNT